MLCVCVGAGTCHGGSHTGTYDFIMGLDGGLPFETCLTYEAVDNQCKSSHHHGGGSLVVVVVIRFQCLFISLDCSQETRVLGNHVKRPPNTPSGWILPSCRCLVSHADPGPILLPS